MDSTDAKERQKPNLAELKERVCAFLDAISERSEEDVKREFGHVHERARELVQRKLAMTGSKSETRDLLGELVFSRLRGGLRNFLRAEDGSDDLKAAEWVMGSLLSMSAISEFSVAIDRAILEMSAPREYSFAGMADFISIEEVMQLLGSGRHVGCLSLEKPDNRIDIYLNFTLSAWDVAAAHLLIEEAGGTITCADGTPWTPAQSKRGILASNGQEHATIRQQINP